ERKPDHDFVAPRPDAVIGRPSAEPAGLPIHHDILGRADAGGQQQECDAGPHQKTTRAPACICRFPPPDVRITPNVARFDMFVPGELKLGEFVTLSACIFTSRCNRSRIRNDLYRNAFRPKPGGERNSARYGGSGAMTYWLASG